MASTAWQMKPLGEVVEFLDGKRIPLKDSDRAQMKGEIPYYGANGQIDSINKHIFDEPLILLAEDGGHFGSKTKPIAYKVEGKSWVNNHAHVLRPANGLDIDFLKWSLAFYDVTKFTTGSTRIKLTKGDAMKMQIPYPDLKTQHKIASILNQADTARQKRREANSLTEEFLQSAFLEMFGDPVRNERGWKFVTVGTIAHPVSSGSTPLGGATVYRTEGIPFIRSQNVLMNELDYSDIVFISNEIHNSMRRTWLKHNDVLINITGASIGRTAVYKGEDNNANVNQHVCIIRLNMSTASPGFLSFQLSMKSFQDLILSRNAGATRQAFTFDQIRNFNVIMPPAALQQKFEALVEQVERLRAKQRESERELENLFQSLMQKYFGA